MKRQFLKIDTFHFLNIYHGIHKVVDKILKAENEEDQTKLAKQAIDLAMLSQGMLKGKDLTAFVKRSVEMI